MMRPEPRGDAGMSLVESIISVALISMIVGVFSWSVNDAMESGASVAGSSGLRERGRRALNRIKRELALSGRLDDAALGITLPIVFADGLPPAPLDATDFEHDELELAAQIQGFTAVAVVPPQGAAALPYVAPRVEAGPGAIREIVFRSPIDLDGDGTIFDSATGGLEWSRELIGFLMVPAADGSFDLLRRVIDNAGISSDEVILRGIEGVTFDTQASRPTLPLQAIEIHLHLVDRDSRGRIHRAHLSTTVMMRNSP